LSNNKTNTQTMRSLFLTPTESPYSERQKNWKRKQSIYHRIMRALRGLLFTCHQIESDGSLNYLRFSGKEKISCNR